MAGLLSVLGGSRAARCLDVYRRPALALLLSVPATIATIAMSTAAWAQQPWGAGNRAHTAAQSVRRVKPGTLIRVSTGPDQVAGRFVSCTPETLMMWRTPRNAAHIPVGTIDRILVRRDSRRDTRAIGFVMGSAVGALIGYGFSPGSSRCSTCIDPEPPRIHPLTFVITGATVGLVLGGSVPPHMTWEEVYATTGPGSPSER